MNEIQKALYVLTLERLQYSYPNAEKRKKVIKSTVKRFADDGYEPIRITHLIDEVIDEVYKDAAKIKDQYQLLLKYADACSSSDEAEQTQRMLDSKAKAYKQILGFDLLVMTQQQPTPIDNSTEIPF